ncbi:serine hydrolase domain-containing protein [Aquimarina sp. 2201CG5-10]|uniref:serine hydrolase domain-containing protein n=1 Tax=Aquimarina callyspongiae TaxID=3098150 RepID=UPI002AB473EF|nr:serine hydrolase domain-containing protein [Aquimarina sp. 2201CG5-10]MDY8134038.1 serine hydrolase domain-containing protein [Aquimarina sp. 2201CG5-10]
MRSYIRNVLLLIGALCLWIVLVVMDGLEGWSRSGIAPHEESQLFSNSVLDQIRNEFVGNIALGIIQNGEIEREYVNSIGESIDKNTLFQVASLSKWITAWGVMSLVEKNKLDLDAPVSDYLTRWRLPDSKFDNKEVTVRRLLSHTAGLTDGLGYGGFKPGVPVQDIESSLTKAADASPGSTGVVVVGLKPGSEWRYSGGGYTLLQLLIEEVTGETFENYMNQAIFHPLGMTSSTFVWDISKNNKLAAFYDTNGEKSVHYRFTSLAATSLYTSLADMEIFLTAHFVGKDNEPIGRGVLSPKTIKSMQEPHGYKYGSEIWGLGAMLYAPNNSDGYIIGHDGQNDPAINTSVRLNPATGNGIIVLETGNTSLATRLAGEWVFWETGNIDFLTFQMKTPQMFKLIISGSIIILVLFTVILCVKRYKNKRLKKHIE